MTVCVELADVDAVDVSVDAGVLVCHEPVLLAVLVAVDDGVYDSVFVAVVVAVVLGVFGSVDVAVELCVVLALDV